MMDRYKALPIASILLCTLAFGANAAETLMPIDKSITLPATIERVWYRTDKVRVFGKAWEQSGDITVTESALEFKSKDKTVTIPKDSIRQVAWDTLSPDMSNYWLIISFTSADGVQVAAFKGALFSGKDKESKIYSALLLMAGGPTAVE